MGAVPAGVVPPAEGMSAGGEAEAHAVSGLSGSRQEEMIFEVSRDELVQVFGEQGVR